MKVSRLFQPRNPLFWIMVTLNLLSLVLGWIARTYSLSSVGGVVLIWFAVGNALLGTYLAWRLMQT
jgi:hypothetical protein